LEKSFSEGQTERWKSTKLCNGAEELGSELCPLVTVFVERIEVSVTRMIVACFRADGSWGDFALVYGAYNRFSGLLKLLLE